jgi:hypothetical protein
MPLVIGVFWAMIATAVLGCCSSAPGADAQTRRLPAADPDVHRPGVSPAGDHQWFGAPISGCWTKPTSTVLPACGSDNPADRGGRGHHRDRRHWPDAAADAARQTERYLHKLVSAETAGIDTRRVITYMDFRGPRWLAGVLAAATTDLAQMASSCCADAAR